MTKERRKKYNPLKALTSGLSPEAKEKYFSILREKVWLVDGIFEDRITVNGLDDFNLPAYPLLTAQVKEKFLMEDLKSPRLWSGVFLKFLEVNGTVEVEEIEISCPTHQHADALVESFNELMTDDRENFIHFTWVLSPSAVVDIRALAEHYIESKGVIQLLDDEFLSDRVFIRRATNKSLDEKVSDLKAEHSI